jgi:hypothetical protein
MAGFMCFPALFRCSLPFRPVNRCRSRKLLSWTCGGCSLPSGQAFHRRRPRPARQKRTISSASIFLPRSYPPARQAPASVPKGAAARRRRRGVQLPPRSTPEIGRTYRIARDAAVRVRGGRRHGVPRAAAPFDDEGSCPAILALKTLRSCCDSMPSPARPILTPARQKPASFARPARDETKASPSGFSWRQQVAATSSIRENPAAAAPFGELLFGLFHANVSGDWVRALSVGGACGFRCNSESSSRFFPFPRSNTPF